MLAQLPPELLASIASTLSGRDIKNIRLTCTRLCDKVPLRMDRVFLSANTLNINVFKAIAQHETLRYQVVEIVYDDALAYRDRDAGTVWKERKGVPRWYAQCYADCLSALKTCREFDVVTPSIAAARKRRDNAMSKQESWKYFSELVRQQNNVIASDEDAKALAFGLERFPNLQRITITPISHGQLFYPF